MKTLAAMISAAALTLPIDAALAEPDYDPSSVIVRYADLDLDDPAGRETLDRRIDSAVRRVCPNANSGTDLRRSAQANACRGSARAGADRQLTAALRQSSLAQSTVRVAASASIQGSLGADDRLPNIDGPRFADGRAPTHLSVVLLDWRFRHACRI